MSLVPALLGLRGYSSTAGTPTELVSDTGTPLSLFWGSCLMFALVTLTRHEVSLAILFLLLGSGFLYAYYPAFRAIPTMMLGETAAAATFRLMGSIGQLGRLAGTARLVFSTTEPTR